MLGWPLTRDGKVPTLEQNLKCYDNLMAKLRFTMNERGVTGHGLRAQFAENFALYKGLVPPSLGGRNDQLPPDELKLRKSWVSEALGHHRPHIVAAYFCAFGREKFHEEDYERSMRHLEQATEVLDRSGYSPVPPERYDDCARIREVLIPLHCDLNLKQIHALWSIVSRREGLEWQAPKGELVTMLEGAALTLLRLDARQRK